MNSKQGKETTFIEEVDSKSFCKDIKKVWEEYTEKKGSNITFPEAAMIILASNTECRLRRVIQEGLNFAMHSKRPGVLKESDIRRALKVEGEKPVEKYLPIKLDNNDDNEEEEEEEEEEEDKVVRLADLKAPTRPELINVERHWLAIEGVQPMVEQNPSAEEISAVSTASVPLSFCVQKDGAKNLGDMYEPPAKVQKTEGEPVTYVLTEELKLLYEKVCASIADGKEYLETYMEELFGNTATRQIFPYLVQFIVNEVKRGGLHDTTERCKIVALLGKIVCPEASLFSSQLSSGSYPSSSSAPRQARRDHFNIEAYLFQLVQIAITCVTTKDTREERESARSPALAARKDAGQVLCSLCNRGYTYEEEVVSSVATALKHVAENGAKPPLSRFGAITALSLLGSDAFNECGLNGAREVAFACSEDKVLCADVKAMVLNELRGYVHKSFAETTDEEKQTKLQDLDKFICDRIESINRKDEGGMMPDDSENQFI